MQDIHGAWSFWAEDRIYKEAVPVVNQHKPTMTITQPNGTSSSPTIVQAEPLVKWNYSDEDGDAQEKYKLAFYYHDTNELALQIEHWNSNEQYQVPENILSDERVIRIEGQVYSSGVWSDVSNKVYFLIIRNRPPTANFTYSPSTVYEGDTITLTDTSTDPDNNITSHRWTIKKPDGSSYTVTTKNASIANASPGTYQVKKKVTDSDGAWDETEWIEIPVHELSITGQVKHTTLWNEHRMNYNRSKTGNIDAPRSYEVFFPGEKFILQAETTDILSSSRVTADKVTVEIVNQPYYTMLTNTKKTQWQGELWNEAMLRWNTRPFTFRFTVYYSNGTIKREDVTVQIQDDPYWRQHGKY